MPPSPAPTWAAALFQLRWGVRGATVLAVMGLVLVEWDSGLLTRVISVTLRNKIRLILFLGTLVIVGRSYLFLPGHLALGDAALDVTNSWAVRRWIESGYWLPYWTNYAGMGMPYMQFRFPFYAYLSGLLDLLIRNPFLSNKALLFGCHIAMVLAMYAYVRKLTHSSWAALFSGLIWSSAFYHYHHYVHLGRLIVALFPVFLPLQLYMLEKAMYGSLLSRSRAVLALLLGIQFWTHTIFAGVSLGLLIVYLLVRLVTDVSSRGSGARMKETMLMAIWILLGVSIGANRLLPVLMESDLVSLAPRLEWQKFPITISWEQVFTFEGSFLTPDWWGGYVSPMILVIGLVGAILAIVRGNRRVFGLIAWWVLAAYLAFGPRYRPFDVIFQNIPLGNLVYVIKVSGWYLVFFEFALTALGGVALREMIARYHSSARTRWHWLPNRHATEKQLVLALGLVLSTQAIRLSMQANSQYPLSWTGWMPNRREMLTWLRNNGDSTSRVIDTVQPTHGVGYEIPMFSGQPSFWSPHPEEPIPSAHLPRTLLSWLSRDFQNETLAPSTSDLLYLLDVGYVISGTGEVEGYPAAYETDEYMVRTVDNHSPLVISCNLDTVGGNVLGTLSGGLDQSRRLVSTVPVLDMASGNSLPSCMSPSIELLEYEVEPQYVRMAYVLTTTAYAQLSYSWYPYIKVLVDGEPADFFPTALDLIGLELPAGAHQIEIIPYLSPVRVYTLVIGAVGVLFAIAVLIWNRGDMTISNPSTRQSTR
ncbi:MAG: hypothetical protein QF690_01895 [Anaerolineales bacterium]|nr:hypothetical protein [Anaerolineales bacterium]